MAYDFNDRLVRELIVSTHFPVELDQGRDGDGYVVLSLVCQKDLRPWPCPAMQQYTEFSGAAFKANAVVNESTRGARVVPTFHRGR